MGEVRNGFLYSTSKGARAMTTKTIDFKVKQLGENDRILRFIGSSETPDRDGDIILASGWELDNYKKNPVFLWAHDASIPPIGKAVNVSVQNRKLYFDIEFPEKGMYPLADTVFGLYKGGFLNATSVGFMGKEALKRDDEAVKDLPEWQRGVKYLKQELLELSAVPVPSNPTALQQAKSKGYISSNVAKFFDIEIDDSVIEIIEDENFVLEVIEDDSIEVDVEPGEINSMVSNALKTAITGGRK